MEKGFALRTTKELYDRLVKEAKDKKWSVNTLINDILERHQKINNKKIR